MVDRFLLCSCVYLLSSRDNMGSKPMQKRENTQLYLAYTVDFDRLRYSYKPTTCDQAAPAL